MKLPVITTGFNGILQPVILGLCKECTESKFADHKSDCITSDVTFLLKSKKILAHLVCVIRNKQLDTYPFMRQYAIVMKAKSSCLLWNFSCSTLWGPHWLLFFLNFKMHPIISVGTVGRHAILPWGHVVGCPVCHHLTDISMEKLPVHSSVLLLPLQMCKLPNVH